jgi:hypothetical protein
MGIALLFFPLTFRTTNSTAPLTNAFIYFTFVISKPGWLSRYVNGLRVGLPEFDSLQWQDMFFSFCFHEVKADSMAHEASDPLVAGRSFSGV